MMTDPSTLQRIASDPAFSIWVAANAGSGKTKVLVDRVLRLLLARVAPESILCITFTKAAAAEMQHRIITALRRWMQADDSELADDMHTITGSIPSSHHLKEARKLFARLLDAPLGLRMFTIHGLCERILSQFPQEAGIPPHFTILEEHAAADLHQHVRRQLLHQAYHDPTGALSEAIHALMEADIAEHNFNSLCSIIRSNRNAFSDCIVSETALLDYITTLYEASDVQQGSNETSLLQQGLPLEDPSFLTRLRTAIQLLAQHSGVIGKEKAGHLLSWLEHPTAATALRMMEHFLTNAGASDKRVLTKPFIKAYPAEANVIEQFANAAALTYQHLHRLRLTRLSHALAVIAFHYFRHYDALKQAEAALDFDDLILRTQALLDDPSLAPWVLYKLDGTIEHLLIDEAQDTSWQQWHITQRLAEEFFAGAGQTEHTSRRLFVVGDSKQSIYGFQGADPQAFSHFREYYLRFHQPEHPFQPVALHTSFRSVQAVLDVVDAVTALPEMREALFTKAGEEVRHIAHRAKQAGSVWCYPLLQSPKQDKTAQHWLLPFEREQEVDDTTSAREWLAEMIATQIAVWLAEGRVLEATGKPITAGDILILVQRRGALVNALNKALLAHHIPLAGLDRVSLKHIAVKDMLALTAWCCNPQDDASLAAALVSPLFGVSYDDLTRLCAYRTEQHTVWQFLQTLPDYAALTERLRHYLQLSPHLHPLAWCQHVLFAEGGMAKMVAHLGESAKDALLNLLYATERYEQAEAASLQGWLDWMEGQSADIKRELSHHANGVRIMTVHGAKGLEAPIVLLPDTLKEENPSREKLLPTYYNGRQLMLYCGNDTQRSGIFSAAYEARETQLMQESCRLLYVALTRACDELHVYGTLASNRNAENVAQGWYRMVSTAMQQLQGVIPLSIDTLPAGMPYVGKGWCYRAGNPAPPAAAATDAQFTPPDWFYQPLPPLPTQPVFLSPSLLGEKDNLFYEEGEGVGYISAAEGRLSANERGTLMHRCLHYQCNQPYAAFLKHLPYYLQHLAPHLHPDDGVGIIAELEAVQQQPELVRLLELPSQSERALMGYHTAGSGLSGQIDRLIFHADGSVEILDIKTGVQPITDEQIPLQYRRQLEAYRDLLLQLMPDTPCRLSLLYTKPPASYKSITYSN